MAAAAAAAAGVAAAAAAARVSLQAPGDEKLKVVVRPYTPVSAPDAAGYLDLVIKAYAQGKMSKHMGDMKVRRRLRPLSQL
jgi:cytochrome-b5 reductase